MFRRQEAGSGATLPRLNRRAKSGEKARMMRHGKMRADLILVGVILLSLWPQMGRADQGNSRQTMDDAWWTGPLLATAAATLPPGHFLFEPYFFDSIPFARFDSHGVARAVPRENNFGSFSYFLYGVADRFTVGIIPRFGYQQIDGGKSSSTLQLGDWSLQGQYQFTQFEEGHLLPTMSLNVMETFPIGKFDQLERGSDGFGAGAYTTTLSLYSQTYFWMPSGRILRTRLNVSYADSSRVAVTNMSVYGTDTGFLGHASPGSSLYGDLALEYSITRNWVAAIDFWAEHDDPTHVTGFNSRNGQVTPLVGNSSTGRLLYVAPALEYNWNGNLGVIAGARVFAWGRNQTALVTPVIAINYVH